VHHFALAAAVGNHRVDAGFALRNRAQRRAALGPDAPAAERFIQQGLGPRLRQNRQPEARVRVAEFKLRQRRPIFIERDLVNLPGFVQDRLGDAGRLQQLQRARIDHLRARGGARSERLVDDAAANAAIGEEQCGGKPGRTGSDDKWFRNHDPALAARGNVDPEKPINVRLVPREPVAPQSLQRPVLIRVHSRLINRCVFWSCAVMV
jgi:hypothetical protein